MGLEVCNDKSCINCSNILYIGEGDFICGEEFTRGLVVSDWNYNPPMPCNGKDWASVDIADVDFPFRKQE